MMDFTILRITAGEFVKALLAFVWFQQFSRSDINKIELDRIGFGCNVIQLSEMSGECKNLQPA